MDPDYEVILNALPPTMRRRFTSLGKYTREVVEKILVDERLKPAQRGAFMGQYLKTIRLVVLVLAVSRFLKQGIEAAENAIAAANSLNQQGVLIGSTEFSRDSKDLAAWRELDRTLQGILDEGKLNRFLQGAHVWNWISAMISEIRSG